MSRGTGFIDDADRVLFAQRIGKNIRYHRTEQELLAADVAAAAALRLNYYTKIERGQSEVPLLIALRIAGALGVELADLIGSTPVPNSMDAAYRTNGDTPL
jgi:transcriptional regulator with XRE-family HTH domain